MSNVSNELLLPDVTGSIHVIKQMQYVQFKEHVETGITTALVSDSVDSTNSHHNNKT